MDRVGNSRGSSVGSEIVIALVSAFLGALFSYFVTLYIEREKQRSIRLAPSVDVQDYIRLTDDSTISKSDLVFMYKNTPITQLWKIKAAIANPGAEIEKPGTVTFTLIPNKGEEIRVFGKKLTLPGGSAATDSDFDKVEKIKDRSVATKEKQDIVTTVNRLRSSRSGELDKVAFILELTVSSISKPSYCLSASIPNALMQNLGDNVTVCPKDPS